MLDILVSNEQFFIVGKEEIQEKIDIPSIDVIIDINVDNEVDNKEKEIEKVEKEKERKANTNISKMFIEAIPINSTGTSTRIEEKKPLRNFFEISPTKKSELALAELTQMIKVKSNYLFSNNTFYYYSPSQNLLMHFSTEESVEGKENNEITQVTEGSRNVLIKTKEVKNSESLFTPQKTIYDNNSNLIFLSVTTSSKNEISFKVLTNQLSSPFPKNPFANKIISSNLKNSIFNKNKIIVKQISDYDRLILKKNQPYNYCIDETMSTNNFKTLLYYLTHNILVNGNIVNSHKNLCSTKSNISFLSKDIHNEISVEFFDLLYTLSFANLMANNSKESKEGKDNSDLLEVLSNLIIFKSYFLNIVYLNIDVTEFFMKREENQFDFMKLFLFLIQIFDNTYFRNYLSKNKEEEKVSIYNFLYYLLNYNSYLIFLVTCSIQKSNIRRSIKYFRVNLFTLQ